MAQFNKPGLASVGLEWGGTKEQAGTPAGTEQVLCYGRQVKCEAVRKHLRKYKDTEERQANPTSSFCHGLVLLCKDHCLYQLLQNLEGIMAVGVG